MAEQQSKPLIVLTDADDELPKDERCPICGVGPERRRLSSGFGEPHDVCGKCGYDFEERTL